MNNKDKAIANSRERALIALNDAALSISRDLALEATLQQIVESAAVLVSARYAALGVFDRDDRLNEFIYTGLSEDEADAIEHPPLGSGMLKVIMEEEKPVRISRLQDDPRSVGFPDGHPPMEGFLGVSIRAGEEILGNLYLTDKEEGQSFSQEDEDLIQIFAAHAAVAIINARRYEKVGQMAVGEERSRLGMDLHDGVIQSIYAVGLTLETVNLVLEENPQKARELLKGAEASINNAILDLRNFILDLRPRRFEGDLNAGLGRIVREFQANTMIVVDVDVQAEVAATFSTAVSRAIFLTTQEGLANVARHARASRVKLSLSESGDEVLLAISDNGGGFDTEALIRAVGHGLTNMRARAEELGGSFVVESTIGEGTTLRLRLPRVG